MTYQSPKYSKDETASVYSILGTFKLRDSDVTIMAAKSSGDHMRGTRSTSEFGKMKHVDEDEDWSVSEVKIHRRSGRRYISKFLDYYR